MRKTKFANDEYCHIYNRGVDKRDVFTNGKDFFRFLLSMNLLNDTRDGLMTIWRDFKRTNPRAGINPRAELSDAFREFSSWNPLVEIIAYCLNPNHFHFILKQITEKGIEKFMHRIGTSYTNYFNLKYDRSGSLFQGRFKSIHIDTNEYLLWLSGYVNGNDRIHSESPTLGNFPRVELSEYSSYPDYLGLRNGTLCNQEEMKIILDQFPNAKEYEKFVEMVIKESRKRKDVEKYLLE